MKLTRTLLLVMASWSATALADSASEYLQQAQDYYSEQEYKAAVIELKNALKEDGSLAKARTLLGEIYTRQGKLDAALSEYLKAARLDAPRADWVIPLAQLLLMDGKGEQLREEIQVAEGDKKDLKADIYALRGQSWFVDKEPGKARENYIKARTLHPEHPMAQIGLARLAVAEGDLERAEKLLAPVMTQQDPPLNSWMIQAEIALRRNDMAAAKDAYQTVLDKQKGHHLARLAIAEIHLFENQPEKALTQIETLLSDRGRDPRVLYLQAKALIQQDDLEAAWPVLQELDRFSESLPHAELLLGYAHYKRGELQQALSALEAFQQFNDKHPGATRLLAKVYLDTGAPDKAVSLLEEAEKTWRRDAQLKMLLGQALYANKQRDEALHKLEQAVTLNPDVGALRTHLAVGLLSSGDDENAFQQLEKAVDLNPNGVEADILLVTALLKQGQPDKAMASAQALVKRHPENPVSHNLLGLVFLSKNQLGMAKTQFESALELDPTFATAHVNLARVAMADDNATQALARIDKALKAMPNFMQAIRMKVAILEKEERFDELETFLNKTWDSPPRNIKVGEMLVNLYLKQGEQRQADGIVETMRREFPEAPETWLSAGRVQLRADNPGNALVSFRKLVGLAPEFTEGYRLLAAAHIAMGDREGALAQYERALEVDSRFLPALLGKAQLALEQQRYEAALSTAGQLESGVPEFAGMAHQIRAKAHEGKGQLGQAKQFWQQAYELSPNSEVAARLGLVMRKLGQHQLAVAHYKEWLSDNPDDNAVRFALASHYQSLGKNEAAMEAYKAMLEVESDNLLALNNLAWLAFEAGEKEQSLAYVTQLEKLPVTQAAILDTMGWILVNHGKLERGVGLLQQALDKVPEAGEILWHLGWAKYQQGNKAEARSLLEKAVASGEFAGLDKAQALLKQL